MDRRWHTARLYARTATTLSIPIHARHTVITAPTGFLMASLSAPAPGTAMDITAAATAAITHAVMRTDTLRAVTSGAVMRDAATSAEDTGVVAVMAADTTAVMAAG